MSFAKLDSGIVNSTIWVQPHDVLRVWIWMLSQADANGMVRTAAPALAHACMVPLDRTREILVLLESPDPDSRSEAEEGRRIEKVDGGWVLTNYRAYRERVSAEEKRENDRVRIAEKRAAARAEPKQVAGSSEVSQPVASVVNVAQAEAEVEEERSNTHAQRSASRFDEFWQAYPKRVGRKPSLEKWKAKKLDTQADTIIADVRNRIENDGRWLDGYIPDPRTYLTQERWNDEVQPRRAAPQPSEPPPRTVSPSPATEESRLDKELNWIRHQRDWLGEITPEEAERRMAEVRAKYGVETTS